MTSVNQTIWALELSSSIARLPKLGIHCEAKILVAATITAIFALSSRQEEDQGDKNGIAKKR